MLSYAKCGELLPYIKKVGSFDEACTQFYAAEIVLALEHLHKLGVIHRYVRPFYFHSHCGSRLSCGRNWIVIFFLVCRDLKPENILLNADMHIQITDFGSAKLLHQEIGGEPFLSPLPRLVYHFHLSPMCKVLKTSLNFFSCMKKTKSRVRLGRIPLLELQSMCHQSC